MFATRTEPDPPAHRCLPCLRSGDPQKQACALRHLAADRQGAAPEPSPQHRPTGPHACPAP